MTRYSSVIVAVIQGQHWATCVILWPFVVFLDQILKKHGQEHLSIFLNFLTLSFFASLFK